MERKLTIITYVILLCATFACGFLVCDYFTETETIVKMSGGKLFYNEDGSDNSAQIINSANEAEIEKTETAYKINLNTATKEELTDLPSIGEKTAEKIIVYRENSLFTNTDELLNIEGIGEKTYAKIKDYVYIEN